VVQLIEANWLIFIAALLIGIVVAWWLFVHGSKPPKREYRPDVLDEGAAPAARNQALIDEPPAAQMHRPPHIDPPAMAGAMAGIGEIIAVAAQEEVDEAAAVQAEKAEAPAPAETAPPAAPESAPDAAPADDLSKIKGVGPKLVALLPTLGVTSYAQIAAMTDADLDALDAKLGTFAGRPRRDNWVEQCKLLGAGDTAGYEAKFGKL